MCRNHVTARARKREHRDKHSQLQNIHVLFIPVATARPILTALQPNNLSRCSFGLGMALSHVLYETRFATGT